MKGRILGTAALSLALVTAGCGGGGGSGTTSGSGVTKVSVNYLPILSLGPLFVAEDRGFFTKQKISNQLQSGNIYSRLAVQAQGKLDVNIPGVGGAFFNAINQGLNIRAVADRQQYRCTSDNLLLVRTQAWNDGVRSVKALKGKKVAILAKGSSTEYWLDKLLAGQGMTEKDLGGISTLSYPDTVNALKTGAVDAGFLVEPTAYAQIKAGVAKRLASMQQVVPNEEQGLITMSKSFLDNTPDVAARWMAAWMQGARYYQDPKNKAEVIKIMAKWTKVPAAQIAPLYGTDQWPYSNPNGAVDTSAVHKLDGKWLVDNKIITSLPADNKWYDPGPVTKALQQIGKVDATRNCASVPKLAS